MRRLFFAVSAILIGFALWAVPLPFYVVRPEPAVPVLNAVRVTGAPDRLSGELLITTVNLVPASTVRAVAQLFERDTELLPASQVIPAGVREQEFLEAQAHLFDQSVRVATAVGLRLTGRDVSLSGEGAEVLQVVQGSPAEGTLRPGDVVVAVNGEPVRLATDLAVRTMQAAPGESLRLTVRRDDAELDVEVAVGAIPGLSQTGIGVTVRTLNEQVALPEGVTVEDVSMIGGPSAGLVLALAVYDLFDPVDLTRGRRVAGTGTVDLSGEVGPIGGVEEKVHGAVLSRATVFLAPRGQAERAREVAPKWLTVIEVSRVEEAIEALRR